MASIRVSKIAKYEKSTEKCDIKIFLKKVYLYKTLSMNRVWRAKSGSKRVSK